MESFSKRIAETFPIETDFTDALETGESLIVGLSTVTVFQDDAGDTDVTSSMIVSGSKQVTGNKLIAKIQGGVENTTYFVKFKAVTDCFNTFSNTVRLLVSDERGS